MHMQMLFLSQKEFETDNKSTSLHYCTIVYLTEDILYLLRYLRFKHCHIKSICPNLAYLAKAKRIHCEEYNNHNHFFPHAT